MMHDELLDIVNDRDEVIGQRYRSEIYERGGTSFRVINAFLINDQQRLWIPRRAAHKKLFPACLDASVGGHVKAGESYQQAFERELREELNIDSARVAYHMIGMLTPVTHSVSAHMHLYLVHTNDTPNYNPTDFMEAQWRAIAELLHAINNGEATKGDLPKLINFLMNQIPFFNSSYTLEHI